MYSSVVNFLQPGHCPGWTVIDNSVCMSACLWTAVAWLTDKMDPYAKHLNDSPGSHDEAHEVCFCEVIFFHFLGSQERIMFLPLIPPAALPSPAALPPPLSSPIWGVWGGQKIIVFFLNFLARSWDSASFIFFITRGELHQYEGLEYHALRHLFLL